MYGLILALLFVLGTVMAIHFTEQPSFCNTCHNMRPYVQAWKTSKHNKVPCVECHFEPGVLSTMRGKFIAINQLTKYVTHTIGPRPMAEVSDKSCLRSGCHERRLIEGKVKWGKITFDHTTHLLSLRRGKKLRCTSCHSQIVIGTHMTVTPTTCYLCHFKNEPSGQAVGGCLSCHKLPKKDIVVQGMRFNHAEYVREGASCDECHLNVTRGNGDVPKERCVVCHGEPDRLKKYGDSSFMHRKHVTEHKVECTQCHDQIEHGAVKLRDALVLRCNTCHGNLHTAPRDLYAGTGGRGVKPRPSPMFLARVDCEGCHTVNKNDERSHFMGSSNTVEEISCMKCHGTGISGVLATWRTYLAERTTQVEKLLHEAEARGGKNEAADRLISDARYNFNIVRYGHGEHNIEYTRDLLDASEDMLRRAINPNAVIKPRTQGGNVSCTQLCHISPPRQTIAFQGKKFPHGRHVDAAGLVCTDCHSAQVHKMTTVTSRDCDTCHHRKFAGDCLRCHKSDIEAVKSYKGKTFPHASHIKTAKLDCAQCHIADKGARMVFRQDCVTCHEHKKPATHNAGWRKAHGKASLAKDAPCANCHKETFCSGCHREQMPHPEGWKGAPHGQKAYAEKAICANCHNTAFCLDCHRQAKPSTGPHKNCTDCHDAKTWKFMGADRTCAKCHKNRVSDKAPEKHRQCIGCHVPHKWKAASPPELCAQCHPKEHAGAAEVPDMADCTICHSPHDWRFAGKETCFGCHDDVAKDVGANNIMPDCTNCHKTHQWKIKSVPDTCGTCHKNVSGHDGDAFKNCTDCHKPHVWKP